MRKIRIHRKIKFASVLMPFWIITDMTQKEFVEKISLSDVHSCKLDFWGHPIKRADFNPDDYGKKIKSGETIEIPTTSKTVFAITFDGFVSNVIEFENEAGVVEIEMSTRGGFRVPSYPFLIAF